MRRFLSTSLGVLALVASGTSALALMASTVGHKALFHFDEAGGVSTAIVTGDAANVPNTTGCLGSHTNPPTCSNGSAATQPAWGTGRYGAALSFDGTDDRVTLPHSAGLNWTPAVSMGSVSDTVIAIEGWIKPVGPAADMTILSKGTLASHNYRLGITAAGTVTFSYTVGGALKSTTGPYGALGHGQAVVFDQWQWISVSFFPKQGTYDVEIRLDGGVNDRSAGGIFGANANYVADNNTGSVTVGSLGGGGPFFRGLMDEVRVSVTTSSIPQPGSNRGVVFNKVVFLNNGGLDPDYVDLYRPNLGDGAPAISLSAATVLARSPSAVYTVPSVGTNCETATTACYQLSPGERVRLWLNGAGPNVDTVGTILSVDGARYRAAGITQWFTSNSANGTDTLGDAGVDLGTSDYVRMRTTGQPDEPDVSGVITLNADGVAWGASTTQLAGLVQDGLWPSNSSFVSTVVGQSGITLTSTGNNLAGPSSWSDSGPTAAEPWILARWTADERVLVEWHTSEEHDLVGFFVRRSLSEDLLESERTTAELLPKAPGAETTGGDYEWYDEEAAPGTTYWYWVESVLTDGSSMSTGPVRVAPDGKSPPSCGCTLRGRRPSPALLSLLALVSAAVWRRRARSKKMSGRATV